MSVTRWRQRAVALCLHQGQVLLVDVCDPHSGTIYPTLPGGGVEVGETLEQAALRETREESGYEARLRPLAPEICRYDFPWNGRIVPCEGHIFAAELLPGQPAPLNDADEVVAVYWLGQAQLANALDHTPAFRDAAVALLARWLS